MSESTTTDQTNGAREKAGTILGGSVIVAGTAIGAGMFSLPVAMSGIWFGYSIALMIFVWFCMYSSALYLLEANLRFPAGASFDTIAEGTIGTLGRVINGASVAFLCYILMYAYISGGSSVIKHTLEVMGGVDMSDATASLIFSIILSAIVAAGARAVDRVSTILIGGMILSFVWSVGGMLGHVSTSNLFPTLFFADAVPFSLGAFGFMTVSFGMQNTVPSITRYLQKDSKKIRYAFLSGSLLALVFYIVWLFSFFGNLPRDMFPEIIAAGGNIGDMLSALNTTGLDSDFSTVLGWFANMAVASSFLGVALCLYDYIVDLLDLDHSTAGRIKASLLTFVPPALLGIFLPDGFITAIGFAGLVLVVFCILSPVIMAWVGRKQGAEGYRVSGGTPRMVLILIFGITAMIFAGLEVFGLLPAFGR